MQALELQLDNQKLRDQHRTQEERKSVFDEQFEEQRRYILEHGLRDPDEQLAHVQASQQQQGGPNSLAEVLPGLDEGELDDFYADVEELDEGPSDD
eukprot:622293-Prymnesium_polylepis.1